MDEFFEITCRVTVERMPPYLDGELTEQRVISFEQHILVCPGCHTFLAQLRRTIEAVAGLRRPPWQDVPDQPPAGVASGELAPEPADAVAAYKFLDADRLSPFARVRWPERGDGWLAAPVAAGPSRPAVYACSIQDLAYWLGERLWRVELAGNVTGSGTKIAADRGRLVAEVDGWPAAKDAFISDCAARLADLRKGARDKEDYPAARKLARYAEEIEDDHDPATVGYTVAHAAGVVGWLPGEGLAAAARGELSPFDAERRRQSRWLAGKLGLAG